MNPSIDTILGFAAAHPGWCPKESTRDNTRARRNVLVALWAGRLAGLEGHALTTYATETHLADFIEVGDDDVIDKIVGDLERRGRHVERATVAERLAECHRVALTETRETD